MTACLLVITALFSFILAKSYGQRAAQISFDRLLSGAAVQIAEEIKMQNDQVVVDLPWSAFETLASAPDDRVFYRVIDKEGQHLTGYPDLPIPPETEQLESLTREYKGRCD